LNKQSEVQLLNRFNLDVMPACLNLESEIKDKFAEAMGWGTKSFGGEKSDELLKGFLNLVSNSICNANYSDDLDELPKGITSSQLCAGDPTRERDTW
jgi:hypothetical protein